MKIEEAAPREKEEAAPREKPVLDLSLQHNLPLLTEMFRQLEKEADSSSSTENGQGLKKKIRRVKEELVALGEQFPQQQVRRKQVDQQSVPRVDDACVSVIRERDDSYYYDSPPPNVAEAAGVKDDPYLEHR